MKFINHNNVDIHLLKAVHKLPINYGDGRDGDDQQKIEDESL